MYYVVIQIVNYEPQPTSIAMSTWVKTNRGFEIFAYDPFDKSSKFIFDNINDAFKCLNEFAKSNPNINCVIDYIDDDNIGQFYIDATVRIREGTKRAREYKRKLFSVIE